MLFSHSIKRLSRTQQRSLRSLIAVLLTLLVTWLVYTGHSLKLIERLEMDLYDLRLQTQLQPSIDPRIVIIDIDEASLQAFGRWPWPRQQIGQLLSNLHEQYSVALTSFDMVFAEPDTALPADLRQHLLTLTQESATTQDWQQQLRALQQQPSNDEYFRQAIEAYQPVLGYIFNDAHNAAASIGSLAEPLNLSSAAKQALAQTPIPHPQQHIANLTQLQQASPWGGFFDNPRVDTDGVYRRLPLLQAYQDHYYPALSLALLMALYQDTKVEPVFETDLSGQRQSLVALKVAGVRIPVDEQGAALVPYRGPQGSFPYISAADILTGQADSEQLAGTIALVGTSAAGLLDLRVTPFSHRYAGVEVHANMLSAMLDERFLSQPDYSRGVEVTQLLLGGILLSLLLPLLKPVSALLLSLSWMGLLIGFNLFAWQHSGWVVPLAHSLLLTLLLFISLQLSGYFFETRNIAGLSRTFGQYIPPELVKELSQQPQISLNGEQREMTVLFADIRDFTQLTERLSPTQLNQLMRTYLSAMTHIIHQHQGTIDKYIGDAIMAFWGAPLSDTSHAQHALQAATAMLEQLPTLNAELQQQGLPAVKIGMGLHSGLMHVGNMGSDFRMAYTVMGDAVNLASRLEGLSKTYGCPLLVSEALAEQTSDCCYRRLDQVQVKGREAPVWLLQPLAQTPADAKQFAAYEQLLSLYQDGQWQQALTHYDNYQQNWPDDKAAATLAARMQEANGQTPNGWSGVYRFEQK